MKKTKYFGISFRAFRKRLSKFLINTQVDIFKKNFFEKALLKKLYGAWKNNHIILNDKTTRKDYFLS